MISEISARMLVRTVASSISSDAHDLSEEIEIVGELLQLLSVLLGLGDLGELRDSGLERLRSLLVGQEGLGLQEIVHGMAADRVETLDDSLLQLIDGLEVDVAHVAKGDELSPLLAQVGQATDERVDRGPGVRDGYCERAISSSLCSASFDGRRCLSVQSFDLLELIDDRFCRRLPISPKVSRRPRASSWSSQ